MNGKEEHSQKHSPQKRGAIKLVVIILVLVLAVTFIGVSLWQDGTFRNVSQTIRFKNSYQAVFLSNGQLYFGKITEITNEYIMMDSPHFLQLAQEPGEQVESEVQPEMKLISIKDEFHKPKDFVMIEKSSVIFIEELRGASQIADAIENF